MTRSPLRSGEGCGAKVNLRGESAEFVRLLEQIERFARSDATVLIQGETGTGKELAARAIHYGSARAAGPFIPMNCGSIPDSLISSELFGHSRGAFTDARESRAGLIAQADRGTLFLDELEALSLHGQVALLRFLEDHEYRPLGTASSRTANVRVIGATNADLSIMAERGEFRRDLIYRIDVLSLAVPPLRARGDDVVVLAQDFLRRLNSQYRDRPRTLHRDAIAALRGHDWPGNVRELENLVHREFLLSDEPALRFASLQRPAQAAAIDAPPLQAPAALTRLAFRAAKAHAVEQFERAYVTELLTRARGNLSLAARLAGKERSRFGRLVRKYSLSIAQFKGTTSEP